LFSLQCLCTAGDIGLSEKGKAKQELKELQQSDCHKQNQLPTKQLLQPTKIFEETTLRKIYVYRAKRLIIINKL
jgi:hypothetical protein